MSNTSNNDCNLSTSPIGIIAGGGPFPITVAEAVIKSGRSVFICALKGFGDPALEKYPHEWVSLGAVGKVLKKLNSAGCQQIVMIGHVKRPDKSLIIPDLGALLNAKSLLDIVREGDDSLLSRIASFFEKKGFCVLGAHELIPESLIGPGPFGKHTKSTKNERDISKGFEVLKILGELDVGQAVVVCHGHVLAVEAAEGTDEMLKRVIKLRKDGVVMKNGGVLVKGLKPNQDIRVDMPVIGPDTVELVADAGLSGIVVQANGVLCHDRTTVIKRADELGVFIEGRMIPG